MQMSRSCRVSYLSASALVRYGLTSRYRSARYVAYHLGDPEYWNSVSTATDMYVELFHAHRSSAVFCGLAVELERQINWQPLALGSFQSNAHKKGMVLIRANGVNMLHSERHRMRTYMVHFTEDTHFGDMNATYYSMRLRMVVAHCRSKAINQSDKDRNASALTTKWHARKRAWTRARIHASVRYLEAILFKFIQFI